MLALLINLIWLMLLWRGWRVYYSVLACCLYCRDREAPKNDGQRYVTGNPGNHEGNLYWLIDWLIDLYNV